jgi:hypothetical protein
MNQPLTHRSFTFYQSSFDDAKHGRETSVFSVAFDPGRNLKYCGSLMICLGIATMFYMRTYFFQKRTRTAHRTSHVKEGALMCEQRAEADHRRAA